MVHGENITRLIEILEYARKTNITCLYDGYITSDKIEIFAGIDAMLRFLGAYHPTGTIFDAEIFRAIPERYKYFESSDMYLENYVSRDMLLKGKGAFIKSGVFSYPSLLIDREKIKSGVESGGNVFNAYYAPRRRTILFCEIFDMIDEKSDIFSQRERDKFFRPTLTRLLTLVSFVWKSLCADSAWLAHYGHGTRSVTLREMLGNILIASRTVETHLKEKGTLTLKRLKVIRSCRIKAIMHCAVKVTAKKILKPIGIWRVLQGLKRFIKGKPQT